AAEADGAPQQLARLACGITGCARTGIVALDEQERLVPVAIAGSGIGNDEQAQWHTLLYGVPLAHFLPAEIIAALRDGRGVMLDTTPSPRREAAFGTTTALIVPMRVGERLIGTLALDSGQPAHDYTDDDRALAAAVAQLTALVLERERLLREAAEAQAALLALAETNRLMNEFLGIAGHELRTPLTAIRANAQLAAQIVGRTTFAAAGTSNGPSTLGDLAVLLGRIEQQSRRQERLVNDLLDVARIEAGELELRPAPLDLVELVREAVAEQRLLHPKRTIRLSLPRAEAPAPVNADADRISQVVSNYLTNALKYSTARQPVAVAVRIQGRRVRVEVHDRGPGLPPDEQARVWERFHRAPGVEVRSGSGIGMGLGLHISKNIVERHGGSVGVESTPGEGCTFWFTLSLLHVRTRPASQQGK
ncbi:MAG TPA: HAMP domain-containing sensor histidine kinase, partial [Ktedonobacterales bacterium]|nr:HAMP domain-containing sensor histidine kinase [Ktedonobacterales bacterium]